MSAAGWVFAGIDAAAIAFCTWMAADKARRLRLAIAYLKAKRKALAWFIARSEVRALDHEWELHSARARRR